MNLLLLLSVVAFSLCLLLSVVAFSISERVIMNREELSSYECGFEHHSGARVPFSLRFFFLTLVFLLFDLEVVLIVFSPLMVFSTYSFFVILSLFVFVFVLFLGLVFEWVDGSLDWLD